jgi:hypothetical protein
LAEPVIHRNVIEDGIEQGLSASKAKGARPACVVFRGMGGSGKTQLVLQFCKKAEENLAFEAIFWIDSSSEQSVLADYGKIARLLFPDVPQEEQDQRWTVRAVKQTIANWTVPWLMVFDSFDHPDKFRGVLREYWPESSYGTVIITSRDEQAELLGEVVRVSAMTDEEAEDLLICRVGKRADEMERADIRRVARRLGNLPLAVAQAGIYIRMHELSLPGFLEEYEVRERKILETVPKAALWEYRKHTAESEIPSIVSTFTTWDLSLDELTGDSETKDKKIMTLNMIAFLSTKSFFSLEDIFKKHAELCEPLPEWMDIFMSSAKWGHYDFIDLLVELKELSLIDGLNLAAEDPEISMHPLVRDWVKLRLDSSAQSICTTESCIMVFHWIGDTTSTEAAKRLHWPFLMIQDTLSTMISCTDNCEKFLDGQEQLGVGILHRPGVLFMEFFLNQGWFKKVEVMTTRALKISEDSCGHWSEETLRLVCLSSAVQRCLGHYDKCWELTSWAKSGIGHMAQDQLLPVPTRVLICQIMILAAQVLLEIGEFDGCEDQFLVGCEGLEFNLGECHPMALEARVTLARYYILARRLDEAMSIAAVTHARFHAISNGIIKTRLIAAEIYLSRRDLPKAHELEAYGALAPGVDGSHHPERLRWALLASILQLRLGKFEEARVLFQWTYEHCSAIFGPRHPKTLDALCYAAKAEIELDHFERALSILSTATKIWNDASGPVFLLSYPIRGMAELAIKQGFFLLAFGVINGQLDGYQKGEMCIPYSEYPMILWRACLLSYTIHGREGFEAFGNDVGS